MTIFLELLLLQCLQAIAYFVKRLGKLNLIRSPVRLVQLNRALNSLVMGKNRFLQCTDIKLLIPSVSSGILLSYCACILTIGLFLMPETKLPFETWGELSSFAAQGKLIIHNNDATGSLGLLDQLSSA